MVGTRSDTTVKDSTKKAKVQSDKKTKVVDNQNSKVYRKSPARTMKQRSPGRPPKAKSPPPSPSRRSPSRRSPARVLKLAPADTKGTTRKSSVVDKDTDSDFSDNLEEVKAEKPKAAVKGRSRKLDVDFPGSRIVEELTGRHTAEVSKYSGLTRRSVRLSHSREVERVVHLKSFDEPVQKLLEFSDEDETEKIKFSSAQTELNGDYLPVRKEFGGWIGAIFFMLSFPLGVVGLQVFCNNKHCSFTKLPNLSAYKKCATYIDVTSILIYASYVLILAFLSALPFGGPKISGLPNKHKKLEYRMNGLFSTVIFLFVLALLEGFNIPVTKHIYNNYLQLTVAGIIIGFLLSIYVYVHSYYVPVSALNPYACTKSKIYNFWMGQELNPRIFWIIDLKNFILRLTIIGVIIINTAFIYKSFGPALNFEEIRHFNFTSVNIQPTFLTIAVLQIIYVIDALIFESGWVSSFEVQYEGLGCMLCLGYAVYPFMPTTITKYVLDYGIELPLWQLVTAATLFLIGYIIYRGSNNQKIAFRKNPYNPALSYLESIPTPLGKKLLVSGYWGVVRHPNYLGDIIIAISWVPFVVFAPPVLNCVFTFLLLLHRALRDGARCKQRYGVAWDRYCQRVKYTLIPKIY